MSTSESIKIDPQTIERFKTAYSEDHTTDGTPGPDDSEVLGQINEALTFGLKTVDKILKNQQLPGLGDQENIELQSELAVIVARRNFSDDLLRKSPEMFLGVIWGGALIQNALAYSQIKKQQPEIKQNDQPESTGENE